jgi:hypothetical protein
MDRLHIAQGFDSLLIAPGREISRCSWICRARRDHAQVTLRYELAIEQRRSFEEMTREESPLIFGEHSWRTRGIR